MPIGELKVNEPEKTSRARNRRAQVCVRLCLAELADSIEANETL